MKNITFFYLLSFLILPQITQAQKYGGGDGTGYGTETVSNLPLPIELVYFSAKIYGETGRLIWKTSFETNNDFFTIEKSVSKSKWEEIGRVSGQGNSNEFNNYEYFDENLIGGIQLYRLKQTDFDGKTTTSKIISLDYSKDSRFKIFPNPFEDILKIELSDDERFSPIQILDITGKVVYQNNSVPPNLNLGFLNSGIYFILINQEMMKIIKN